MLLINSLLLKISALNASDLFVISGKNPQYKINGEMLEDTDPGIMQESEINKFRSEILSESFAEKYHRYGNVDVSYALDDGTRFRINFFLSKSKPGFVARIIPSGDLEFNELDLPEKLKDFLSYKNGLIIVSGTAGCGKSTTIAAMVNYINRNFKRHIITMEDPIEFIHTDKSSLVTQREIGADVSDFATALRSSLRESPDVIMIGEIRDIETITSSIAAALTGHLVITTVHTANVLQTLERIINSAEEKNRSKIALDLSLCLRCIIAQRLISRIDKPGRIPCLEILVNTPTAAKYISENNLPEVERIVREGLREGMITFDRSLSQLYKDKKISLESGIQFSTNKDEFLLLTKGIEVGIDTFRSAPQAEEGPSPNEFLDMKQLLNFALQNKASDLILSVGTPPIVRINGDLVPLNTPKLRPPDTARLFFSVLTTSQRSHFEDKKEIDFALSVNIGESSSPARFRVNGFYQKSYISAAIRLINDTIPSPESLGLPESLVKLSDRQQGLILITGPTGHGKSTTMASLIDRINRKRACHIITIEDPIEYIHTNRKSVIEQREIHADTISYSNALKYVLRQDPDVILIGEMRDPETIAVALTAAETGHLVFSTLHTNNTYESINRIIDTFAAAQQNQIKSQLAACLAGIVSQRLIPKADGSGRVCACEILIGTTAVKALIRESKIHLIPSSMETSAKEGMITMNRAISDLYKKGLISKENAEPLVTDLKSWNEKNNDNNG